MPVPTSNIGIIAINNEVGSVNSTSLTTLATNAISYTGGNSPVLTDSLPTPAPHGIREFAGYVHTQNFTNSTARYYNGSIVSSNPYAANQTSISSSVNDITNLCTTTETDVSNFSAQASCESRIDLKVTRVSSYFYVDVRQTGVGTLSRALYRENNQSQTITTGSFFRIMRFTPSVNPGGVQVGITQGNTTTIANSTNTGGIAAAGAESGNTSSGGFFSTYGFNQFVTLSNNNQSVGVRWKVNTNAENIGGQGTHQSVRDSTSIFNIVIKASGYNDLQLGSVMLRGKSTSTAINLGGGYNP